MLSLECYTSCKCNIQMSNKQIMAYFDLSEIQTEGWILHME